MREHIYILIYSGFRTQRDACVQRATVHKPFHSETLLILFCALEFGAVWGGALALDVGFVGWLCFGVA